MCFCFFLTVKVSGNSEALNAPNTLTAAMRTEKLRSRNNFKK